MEKAESRNQNKIKSKLNTEFATCHGEAISEDGRAQRKTFLILDLEL